MARSNRRRVAAVAGSVAACVAASITLGLGAPVASATPHSHAAGKASHAGVKGNQGKSGHDKKASQRLRQLLREVAAVDARLARVAGDDRVASLDEEQQGSVLA